MAPPLTPATLTLNVSGTHACYCPYVISPAWWPQALCWTWDPWEFLLTIPKAGWEPAPWSSLIGLNHWPQPPETSPVKLSREKESPVVYNWRGACTSSLPDPTLPSTRPSKVKASRILLVNSALFSLSDIPVPPKVILFNLGAGWGSHKENTLRLYLDTLVVKVRARKWRRKWRSQSSGIGKEDDGLVWILFTVSLQFSLNCPDIKTYITYTWDSILPLTLFSSWS